MNTSPITGHCDSFLQQIIYKSIQGLTLNGLGNLTLVSSDLKHEYHFRGRNLSIFIEVKTIISSTLEVRNFIFDLEWGTYFLYSGRYFMLTTYYVQMMFVKVQGFHYTMHKVILFEETSFPNISPVFKVRSAQSTSAFFLLYKTITCFTIIMVIRSSSEEVSGNSGRVVCFVPSDQISYAIHDLK